MYTSAIFVAIGLVAMTATFVAADPDKECMKFYHHGMHCCQKPEMKKTKVEGIEECFPKDKKPKHGSCEIEICIAKKKGFGTDDGKFDKKGATEFIETEFGTEVAAAVKKECIEGDLSKFGRPDTCDLMKLRHCINRTYLKNCEEWKEEGECSKAKDLVKKCIA